MRRKTGDGFGEAIKSMKDALHMPASAASIDGDGESSDADSAASHAPTTGNPALDDSVLLSLTQVGSCNQDDSRLLVLSGATQNVADKNIASTSTVKHDSLQVSQRMEAGQNRQHADGNNDKICGYYKKLACKFGTRGVDCNFAHPKMCFRFLKNGDKADGGCTKGKKCTYYHPPLCRNSVRAKQCAKENCKFAHLKGTKRGLDEAVKTETWTSKHPRPSREHRLSNTDSTTASGQQTEIRAESQFVDNQAQQPDYFLVLQQQILQLQVQMQRILDHPPQKSGSQCSCPGQRQRDQLCQRQEQPYLMTKWPRPGHQ